jgi:hypothetical protein
VIRTTVVVAMAVAIVTTLSCAAAGPPKQTAFSGPPAPPLATASTTEGTSPDAREYQVDTQGIRESPAQLLPGSVLWSSVSSGADALYRIHEFTFATKESRTLYTAPPRVRIQLFRASTEWLVWFEALRDDGADAKLFAQPAAGGAPILVDDMSRHAPLAAVPDLTLDGASLYWTIPAISGTIWRGSLRHRTLPVGPVETVVSAGDGQLVGWPSARSGDLAYEIATQGPPPTSRIHYQRGGSTVAIPTEPASEPTIGEGYIAFKRQSRFVAGELAVYNVSTGTIAELGPGEAPLAQGRFIVWYSSKEEQVRLASPPASCVRTIAGGSSAAATEFLPSLGAGRVAFLRRDARESPPTDKFIVRPLSTSGCG